MRIRSIKETYWQHDMHGSISETAAILGAALLNYADDEGRFKVNFAMMKSLLFTCREAVKAEDVKKAFAELEAVRYVFTYSTKIDGLKVALGKITNFERHQNINRPVPSRLPAPPRESSVKAHGVLSESSVSPHNTIKTKLTESSVKAHGVLSESSVSPHNTIKTKLTESSVKAHGVLSESSLGKEGRSGVEGVEGGREVAGATLALSPQFQEPSLQDVLTFAEMSAIPEDCATKWFWDKKGDGWIVRGEPIRDWQAKLRGYAVSWRGQEFLNKTGTRGTAGTEMTAGLQQLEAELQAETDPEKRRLIREKMREAGK